MNDVYEEIYEDLCELLSPHVKTDVNGLSRVSQDSLTGSVIESFEYLLEFWVANRNKVGVDSCL